MYVCPSAGRQYFVYYDQTMRNSVSSCYRYNKMSCVVGQVLSAATVIAKHTSALCNACRVASGRTAAPQPKRHFVQAAKDVANCTAALVKEIKALDTDYSEVHTLFCHKLPH